MPFYYSDIRFIHCNPLSTDMNSIQRLIPFTVFQLSPNFPAFLSSW
jgi:hypothetical protein